jgi:hypothetical protein
MEGNWYLVEMIDKNKGVIKGTEGIILHNGNIVLGMQKPKRWYQLENGETASIIKTIGGKIEVEDEESSKKALVREILEEIKGIEKSDVRVSTHPIFSKVIRMGDFNPFERKSNLKLSADFYAVVLTNKERISPNDLPALVEMPIQQFLKLPYNNQNHMATIEKFIIPNHDLEVRIPQNYALMIPTEIRTVLKRISELEVNRGVDCER